MEVVGIVCEVAATVLGTLGKQLVSRSGKVATSQQRCALKVAGLTVTSVFGPLLDAAAYALAPQSLVAPLNGLDIVWNTCSAPFTLGEHLTKSHVVGSLLVFVGSSLSSLFGQHHNDPKTLEQEKAIFVSWSFFLYALVSMVGLLASALILRQRPRNVADWPRGMALGGTAGFVAGNMFFLSEALGMLRAAMTTGDWSAWQHWLPYVITAGAVIVAVSNVPLMSKALEEYDALFMITLFAGCQITTACVSAAVVLREMQRHSWLQILAYWGCILLIVLGLLVVGRKARILAKKKNAIMDLEASKASPLDGTASNTLEPVLWAGSFSGIGVYSGLVSEPDEEQRKDREGNGGGQSTE